jgi:transposase
MAMLQKSAEDAIRLLLSDARRGKVMPGRSGKQKSTKHSFSRERNTAILWLTYKGWSGDAIAEQLDYDRSTVYLFRKKVQEQPWLLFDYPVLTKGVRGNHVVWKCEVCGSTMVKLSERKAREHVALHYLSPEVIRYRGLYHREW